MIVFEDVVKLHHGTTALGPISGTIPAGGLTSIIGPNGAGKSTLLTIIGRLQEPTSGRVSIAGHDVQHTPSRQLARLVSILRQENHFTSRLRVRELVAFGRFPHSGGRLTEADQTIIDDALEFLNLRELADRYLDELSGGQRQRAYVAMVLAQDTEYVLLDEPLNNLDMKHGVEMMEQLRRAVDELHRTVVLIVHDVNFAAQYSDRVLALRDGALVDQGTPEEIMTPTRLEAIFDTPIQVHRLDEHPVAVYYRPDRAGATMR